MILALEQPRLGMREKSLRPFVDRDLNHESGCSVNACRLSDIARRGDVRHDLDGRADVDVGEVAVQHRTHSMRAIRQHIHTTLVTQRGKCPGIHLDFETDDVGLNAVEVHTEARSVCESLCEPAGSLDIRTQVGPVMFDRVQGCRSDHSGLSHATTELLPEATSPVDKGSSLRQALSRSVHRGLC